VEVVKKLCEAVYRKGLNFGPMIGSSTMMLQLTRHSLSKSFWPKNQLVKLNTPYSHNFAVNDLGLFPEIVCLKGADFRILKTSKNASYATVGVPKVFPTVAALLA
jgi:hypothetical protein